MTNLRLNDSFQDYKEFCGRNIDEMPKLLAEGRIPLSVAGLMKRRLEVLNASDEVRRYWWNNYFDTGDSIIYHPDGKARIVLDAQLLRGLNPRSKLSYGALVLSDGMYEQLECHEFSKSDLETFVDFRWLKEREVRCNPIWKALARDQKLLDDYSKAVFSEIKRRGGIDDAAMALFRASPSNVPTMRLWRIGGLYGKSLAISYLLLGSSSGRFVGVVP